MIPCANNCGECPDWNAGCKKGILDIGDCAFIGTRGFFDQSLREDIVSPCDTDEDFIEEPEGENGEYAGEDDDADF